MGKEKNEDLSGFDRAIKQTPKQIPIDSSVDLSGVDLSGFDKAQEDFKNPISSGLSAVASTVGSGIDTVMEPIKRYAGENALRGGLDKMLNPSIEDIQRGDLITQGASAAVDSYGKPSSQVANDTDLAKNMGGGLPESVARIGLGQVAGAPTTAAISGIAKGTQKAFDYLPKKVGSAISGISEKNIETYAQNKQGVNNIIQKYGEDSASAADDIQKNILDKMYQHKNTQNSQISDAINKIPDQRIAHVDEITSPLKQSLNDIDEVLNPKAHEEINKLINTIQAKADNNGFINLKDSQNIKNWLREHTSYKQTGTPFNVLDQTELSAKSAAANIKKIIDSRGPKEIYEANRKLESLHDSVDSLNNLLKTQKPENALNSIGAGTNPRTLRDLKAAGELLGEDFISPINDYSAYRAFQNPSLLPVDATGKSVARQNFLKGGLGLAGGGLGYMAGGTAGATAGTAAGYAAGNVLSSPVVVKKAIDFGAPIAKGVNAVPNKLLTTYLANKTSDSLSSKKSGPPSNEEIFAKVQNTKYAPQFNAAKQRNGDNSAQLYFKLGQSDPEFRKLFQNNDNN